MCCDCNVTAFIFPSCSIDRNQNGTGHDRWGGFLSDSAALLASRKQRPRETRGRNNHWRQTVVGRDCCPTLPNCLRRLKMCPSRHHSRWVRAPLPLRKDMFNSNGGRLLSLSCSSLELCVMETRAEIDPHPHVNFTPERCQPCLLFRYVCVCPVNLIIANREKWINNGKANTVANRSEKESSGGDG